jgi:glycerol-3-phosphate O-acyltransferase
VRFGDAAVAKRALQRADVERGGGRWTVEKIAFEVFERINRVTPVTAPALVTLALLGVGDRGLTLGESATGWSSRCASTRCSADLPTAQLDGLKARQGLAEVLSAPPNPGSCFAFGRAPRPVHGINPGPALGGGVLSQQARSTGSSTRAITELAWFMELGAPPPGPAAAGVAARLRVARPSQVRFLLQRPRHLQRGDQGRDALLDPRFKARAADPRRAARRCCRRRSWSRTAS